jgi:3-oxoacyl-[acyl-carrier protein] reductase
MTDQPRIALVTGAARGIGLAVSAKLVEAGHCVAMVDVDRAGLEEAVQTLPSGQVLAIPADIGDPDAPARLQDLLLGHWGTASILVNNAAISPKHAGRSATLGGMSDDEWDLVMRINVTAPMRLARQFVPAMRDGGWGRVVNMSSRAGRTNPHQASAAYATSKAAILGLTRAIATEFSPFGVTANAIAPGLVATKLIAAVSPEIQASIQARTPAGRAASPEEIGAVVAFLASPGAAFITGTCLDVNGGAFMC